MRKSLLLATLVLFSVSLLACSSDVDATKPDLHVLEWAGTNTTGNSTYTETFTVNSPWDIEWTNNPSMVMGYPAGSLVISVHADPKDMGRPYVSSTAKESGKERVDKAGTFLLEIKAHNTIWTVKVSDN